MASKLLLFLRFKNWLFRTFFSDKPRRIIQDQPLILLLLVLAWITPIPLCGFLVWVIFILYPFSVPYLLVSWGACFFIYLFCWIATSHIIHKEELPT